MRLRPLCVVVLTLLLVPGTARASDHVASIFGGFSRLSGSTLKGGHGTMEVSFPRPQRVHDHLDLLVDASVYGGTDDAGDDVTKATLMFGPRFLTKIGDRLVLFAHVVGGIHRSHVGAVADNGGAAAAGAGFDILLNGIRTAKTPAKSGWILRTQVDWARVAGANSVRASAGFGYRYREIP